MNMFIKEDSFMSQHSHHSNQRIMRSIKKSCVLVSLAALAGATVFHTIVEAQDAYNLDPSQPLDSYPEFLEASKNAPPKQPDVLQDI